MIIDDETVGLIHPLPGRALIENLPTWELVSKGGIHLPASAYMLPPMGKARVLEINYREDGKRGKGYRMDEKDMGVKKGDIVYYHTSEQSLGMKYFLIDYRIITCVIEKRKI